MKISAATIKPRLKLILLVIAALIGFLLVISLISIYLLGSFNWLSRTAASLLPLPAAKIDGQVLTVDSYLDIPENKPGEAAAPNQAAGLYGPPAPDTEPVAASSGQVDAHRQIVIQYMVLERQAKQHSIEVSAAEIDTYISLRNYSPELSDRQRRVMARMSILENKLAQALADEGVLTQQVTTEASEIISDAQTKGNLQAAYDAWSKDEANWQTGSRLDSLRLALADEPIQQAAQSLSPGKIADQQIQVNGSVYIVQRLPDEAGQAMVRTVTLIGDTFDSWLAREIGQASFTGFLPRLR